MTTTKEHSSREMLDHHEQALSLSLSRARAGASSLSNHHHQRSLDIPTKTFETPTDVQTATERAHTHARTHDHTRARNLSTAGTHPSCTTNNRPTNAQTTRSTSITYITAAIYQSTNTSTAIQI